MGKMAKRKTKKKPQRALVLIKVISVLVIAYVVVSLVQLQIDLVNKKQELAALNSQITAQQQENASLQTVVDTGGDLSFIEKIAREQLGYVSPDERVYIDISGS